MPAFGSPSVGWGPSNVTGRAGPLSSTIGRDMISCEPLTFRTTAERLRERLTGSWRRVTSATLPGEDTATSWVTTASGRAEPRNHGPPGGRPATAANGRVASGDGPRRPAQLVTALPEASKARLDW